MNQPLAALAAPFPGPPRHNYGTPNMGSTHSRHRGLLSLFTLRARALLSEAQRAIARSSTSTSSVVRGGESKPAEQTSSASQRAHLTTSCIDRDMFLKLFNRKTLRP